MDNISTWKEKRKEILKRDNFTCQKCQQFNPELGVVELYDEINNGIELHEYINHPDPSKSIYRISQSYTGYTFEINFGNCWPVFPIMQIHHKRYINGKEDWDYEDEDLITLCKNCHKNLHRNKKIPTYSKDNVLLKRQKYEPSETGFGRKHQCEDWSFIKKVDGEEYVLSNIEPTITFVLLEHEELQHAELEAKSILDKFIRKYFPKYIKKE